jgi:Spy/CpxP family protein refolding chaperone
MTTTARSILLTLALCLLASGLAAWGGASYAMRRAAERHEPLHALVHEQLQLSAAQEQRIEALETAYGVRRHALEAQMRAANAELSDALAQDHAYSPKVQRAVDHLHLAMGELQKQTILHVLAMRAVLTPAQTVTFDRTIARALVQTPA